VPFDEPGIQVITLSLITVAAMLGLVSVTLGLLFTLMGRDPLPKPIRRLLRRVPASADDFRLRGMSLTLNGAAVTMIVSLVTINVAGRLAGAGWSGYAPATSPGSAEWSSVAFPEGAVFLVTTVASLAAVACFIGAYTLGIRVRYVTTRGSIGANPGMPPA
jgi:hypothetical protein